MSLGMIGALGARTDFVAGIDFGGTKIAMATADLRGRVVAYKRVDTQADQGAEQAIIRSLEEAGDLIESTRFELGGECLGVGVVSPGVVVENRMHLAPNVPGWNGLSLGDQVRERLGVGQVQVDNDVKSAAVAETRWGSLRGVRDAVFLSLGTGVGAALVIGGRVYSGAHGAAGEIGYFLRRVEDAEGFAAGRAPLEESAGGRAIGIVGSRAVGKLLDAADVFRSSDPKMRRVVEEALAELAMHVANLAILLDPARIVIGGGLMRSGGMILPVLAERLRTAVPFPPELGRARFVHTGALRGAILLVLDSDAFGAQRVGIMEAIEPAL